MSSWQAPLAKLVGLIVLLPFMATYLNLYYYAYWKNEYCFVGPHASMVSGKRYDGDQSSSLAINIAPSLVEAGDNNADNGIRGESTTATTDETMMNIDGAHGIYAPLAKKKKKGQNIADRRQFQQRYATTTTSAWFGHRGWPSITQSFILISTPSSQLSNSNYRDSNRNFDHTLTFVKTNEEKKWCLFASSSSPDEKWCSDPLSDSSDGTIYAYPPSGIWKYYPSSPAASSSSPYSKATVPPLVVSCPAPATYTPSKQSSRHKGQNGKQNRNVEFILYHPATTLILLLNTGLAFHYWNQRVNPSAVCKQYTKIVVEHEWWRGLTGALAHFEPLHIGFNMMSMHTLGTELEGGFGSIVFLVYNVALVVFTTVVMMGMVYARIRWIQHKLDRLPASNNSQLHQAYQDQQQRLRETSTVGFSAVLFAWMVVSTMERNQPTCPIPFFSDVCFETYSVPGLPFLKFNISPIVSLFVAQFIMPRVSFMGHLAGIVCGFCLHWGAMPPLEICSPNVLIGAVFLIGLIWRRRVIPVKPLLTAKLDEEGCVEHEEYLRSLLAEEIGEEGERDDSSHHHPLDQNNGNDDPFMRSKQKKKDRERNEGRRKQKTLLYIRNTIAIVTLASLFVLNWNSSLFLSQCILLAYFAFGTQSSFIVWAYTRSKVESDIIEPEKARAGMIWRGFFMSTIISVVFDSMSMASWIAWPTLISVDRYRSLPIGLLPAILFMIIRTFVNLVALVISSKILHDLGQVGGGSGIFWNIFATEISWTKLIGDHGVFISQRPTWTAFEGRGITLGRGR